MRVRPSQDPPRLSPERPAFRRRGLNIPLLLFAIFVALVVMALKNSQICYDNVRVKVIIYRGAPMRTTQHLPCEFRCCGDSPWTCQCSSECPCQQHPGRRTQQKP